MTYRKDIDALKGIAIIAVVFYHLGILRSGYLGVDVFFVISGFLLLPGVCNGLIKGEFSCFRFVGKRLLRLLPLVVVASFVCMLVGLWGMLPDSYENLAESVVASNLFSENILSAITTGDYWNVNNDYKPLMHLWYVGVLFQFYLIVPLSLWLLFWLIRRISGKEVNEEQAGIVLGVLCAVSLVLYLLPFDSSSNKFYFVHYRAFELLLGGIVGWVVLCKGDVRGSRVSSYQCLVLALLVFVLFSSLLLLSPETVGTRVVPIGGRGTSPTGLIQARPTLLLITVALSALLVRAPFLNAGGVGTSALAFLGQRSYSIFIWHQVLLAFYRYFFSKSLSVIFVILFLMCVLAVSELSYRFIEKKTVLSRRSLVMWIVASFVVVACALGVYLHAGVVRDVPEQNITFGSAHRHMHAEYVDRVYQFDKDFAGSGRPKVLVEGSSFARDFANCLLESDYPDSVEISYISRFDEAYPPRVQFADYVFTFMGREEVPAFVLDNVSDGCQLWGIGTKNYGECNGAVYRRRFSDDYFDATVAIPQEYNSLNDQWRKSWGDHYFDFIRMAEASPGVVRVFTPDGKFISQDCEHLTREGARWYAGQIPWGDVFGE